MPTTKVNYNYKQTNCCTPQFLYHVLATVFILKNMNKVIEFLKTLPENSGQKVEMETSNGIKQFYFMWFYDEKRIDLKPCDNINIYTVHKRFWDRINLVF